MRLQLHVGYQLPPIYAASRQQATKRSDREMTPGDVPARQHGVTVAKRT